MEEKRHPLPGDKDYKGGYFVTDIYRDGKRIRLHCQKNAKGDIVSVREERCFFIF